MNGLRNFMNGRYGADRLSFALIIFSGVIMVILSFIPVPLLRLIAYLPLGYAAFRILSKNHTARQQENEFFGRFYFPAVYGIKKKAERLKQMQTHKFYKCPNCRQQLRVPRGRGKIEISCPKCKASFIKKT